MSLSHPFLWEAQARRDVLDEEWSQLRDLPYIVWRAIVLGGPISKVVTGSDQRAYRVVVSAEWDQGSDVRVTLVLTQPTGLRRRLLRQTFVMTPTNRVHA